MYNENVIDGDEPAENSSSYTTEGYLIVVEILGLGEVVEVICSKKNTFVSPDLLILPPSPGAPTATVLPSPAREVEYPE